MKELSIREIKEIFQQIDKREFINRFIDDDRQGVLRLKKQAQNHLLKLEKLEENYNRLNTLENQLLERGYLNIAGIDEVGRGPLAGPVVCACVKLNKKIIGLNDSKKLSDKQRRELFKEIQESATISTFSVSPEEIDEINIYQATKYAMEMCVKNFPLKLDALLVDAMPLKFNDIFVNSINKGDTLSNSIAAASICAKVIRDNYMIEMHDKYPQYNFKSNKGYGSQEHIQALKKYGLSPIHRKSFCKFL